MPYIVQVLVGGLNSIFDMLILMLYLKTILQTKKEHVSKWFYYVAFLGICGVQYGIGWFTDSWMINMSCSLIGIYVLSFLYKNRMMTRIFAMVSFQVFAMLSELICYILIQFTQKEDLLAPHSDSVVFINMISRLILFIIVILIANFLRKNTAILLLKDYLFMLVTPLVSMVIIIAITMQYQKDNVSSGISISISVAGITIINFIVYYLLENIIEATEIREKQSRMEAQLDYQEEKYEQATVSFKSISSIIHDTNKHLLYIRECVMENEHQEAVDYINHAIEAVDKSYKRFHTGNLVVDALMSNAAHIAENKKIAFESHIHINGEKMSIDRYDFSVVLGNLLDNAMEACDKITENPYVKVTIETTETALFIDVVNSALHKVNLYGGYTDKKDKNRHGYGIQNIDAVAQKYGGVFHYEYQKSCFVASVILPFKD